MYNLIMGVSAEDTMMKVDRMLEHTKDWVKSRLVSDGRIDLPELQNLPALVMPELQDTRRPQVAVVGTVESVSYRGDTCLYRFIPNTDIPPIPSEEISAIAPQLQIDVPNWEFSRTHWAVKDVDLYRVLLTRELGPRVLNPTVFTIPSRPPARDLVSVMMPFNEEFSPVFRTLSSTVLKAGWHCKRADDIWNHDSIVQDIVDLIAESQVVICDLSGRNANVFYEAGIAHALGRPVVLLAQHPNDVPFDLSHLRHISYKLNGEGLAELAAAVLSRLQTLMAR